MSTEQHERTSQTRTRRCTVTQQHCIAGIVMDTDNTPLEGVSVKMYRSSFRQIDQIGSASTEANGQYVAHFDAGSPVLVRYDHLPGGLDNCHPAILSHLSGASNHTLNVVMYKSGRPYQRDDLLDILSAYERLYLIDVSNNVPVAEIRDRYRIGLGMMKGVDEMTEQRHRQVTELYEQDA
jgi:hypothetical protein